VLLFSKHAVNADDVSLPVPPDQAEVEIWGHRFGVFEVDSQTARVATGNILARMARQNVSGVQLSDCRVIRVSKLEETGSPTYFLGTCGASSEFCFGTKSDSISVGQSSSSPTTARQLVERFPDCLDPICDDFDCR
jgi:hypothetical protein